MYFGLFPHPMLTLQRVARGGFSLIFPPCCAHCGKFLDVEELGPQLCDACSQQVFTPTQTACPRCGIYGLRIDIARNDCVDCRGTKLSFDRVLSLGPYEGALQSAVIRMKYEAGQSLAVALGKRLAEVADYSIHDARPDLVTCIPKYWLKRLATGVNSAETIMSGLGKQAKVSVLADLLVCQRKIRKQSLLTPDQRRRNVRRAWRLSDKYDIQDADIVVVDDTMTTGATANEVARVLKNAGARRVSMAVVGRAMKLQ